MLLLKPLEKTPNSNGNSRKMVFAGKSKTLRALVFTPLAALGASGASASNVYTSGGEGEPYRRLGQDLSRSISSTRTAEERALAGLQLASLKMDVEGKALDNQIRLSQLRKTQQVGPPMAGSTNFMGGQGDSGLQNINPSQRTTSQPGRPAQEAGWVPDVGYARTDTGFAPVPSKDVKERIEDQMIPEAMWALRNQLMPNFGGGRTPPKSQLPPGAMDWKWHAGSQEYRPVYSPQMHAPGRKPIYRRWQ